MSLTNIEKLEFLGFQFWQKKVSDDFNAKEAKNCFVAIQSILFCFSNRSLSENNFEYVERFMTSIAITLNSQEPCKFLDLAPRNISVDKIIQFGGSSNKELLEKEFPDAKLTLLPSFEDLFSNSQLKKELWVSIKD